MRNFPVFGFPSSCGDVQPQRTSLVIRTEHNLLNKKQKRGTVAWKPHSLSVSLFSFFCKKNRVSHDAAYK